MKLYIAEGFWEVRIWMGEDSPPLYKAEERRQIELSAVPAFFSSRRSAGVELYQYVGPRTMYPALGGVFTYEETVTLLSVQLNIVETPVAVWEEALHREMDTIYVGFPEEFCRGVQDALQALAKNKLLEGGTLCINRAAYGVVGSYYAFFYGATFLLWSVIKEWERLEPIRQIQTVWDELRKIR